MEILLIVLASVVGFLVGYVVSGRQDAEELRLYSSQLADTEDEMDEVLEELAETQRFRDALITRNVVIFNVRQDEMDEELPLDFSQHEFDFEDGVTFVRSEN